MLIPGAGGWACARAERSPATLDQPMSVQKSRRVCTADW